VNIFYLDQKPETCAKLHCDKHVCKMIIEYAQLMSTAHRTLDGVQYTDKTANNRNIKRWRLSSDNEEAVLYKASHINHPSNIWTRESKANYIWLYTMWIELCKEYTHRYGKTHLTEEKLGALLAKVPNNIPDVPMTTLPQAMPDDVKEADPIKAYKSYYRNYKKDFAKWTGRAVPEFMNCHAL